MPETRYTPEIHYPPDIPASEKTVANAEANGWIVLIPYEISDEELAEKAGQATCEEYLGHSPPHMTHPEVCFVLRCLAKKLGYTIKKD